MRQSPRASAFSSAAQCRTNSLKYSENCVRFVTPTNITLLLCCAASAEKGAAAKCSVISKDKKRRNEYPAIQSRFYFLSLSSDVSFLASCFMIMMTKHINRNLVGLASQIFRYFKPLSQGNEFGSYMIVSIYAISDYVRQKYTNIFLCKQIYDSFLIL